MKRRKYCGEVDLKLLQDFNVAAIAATNHCGYLHPGDIPHHIYNGNRHYNPFEMMTLWEDDQGLAAWLLVAPDHKSFDAQVRPDLRGNDLEQEILEYARARTAELMRENNIASEFIYADAFRCDMTRRELLSALGWELIMELPYVLNRTRIDSIAVPALPDGYSFRSANGINEAAALADIHNAAFGAIWTPELYQRVMKSPGYEPERELLIQAPDGRFVAFSIIWLDHLNSTGLFEPVGTRKELRRRGFGRAIILYGLQQMAARGMKFATVAHFGDNEAARGLYQSCGFKPWYLLDDYKIPFK